MEGIDQRPDCVVTQPLAMGFEARTTVGTTRNREVQSRYLQSKRTPAAQPPAEGLKLAGRHSLAACNSTGWVELQLNTTSTPSIVGSGSSSAVITQKSRAQQPLSTPAPGSTPRAVHCQLAQQQQRLKSSQQSQHQKKPNTWHRSGITSAATAAVSSQAVIHQHHQQLHDVQSLPDTCRRLSSANSISQQVTGLRVHNAAATSSTRSSRSSTSCTTRPSSVGGGIPPLLSQADPTELCTPQVSRLTSSVVMGHGTAIPPQRLGMSAGVAALPAHSITVAKGAEDMRRKLEEYKQQKRLEQKQVAQRNATRGSQGGFKEPQPRALKQGASVTGRGAAATLCAGPAAAVASAEVNTSPSQFTATMKTLQLSGSGNKSSKPLSSSKSGPKPGRPAGVPLLQMDRLQQAAHTTTALSHAEQQQQTARSPLAPGSYSRIPHFSTGGHAQEVAGPLLSSRTVSSAAHVPLPDATPRAIKDAPLSKLPKTPRGIWTPTRTLQDTDVAAKPARPLVPGLRLGGLGEAQHSKSAAEASALAAAEHGVTTNRYTDNAPIRPVAAALDNTASSHVVHTAGPVLAAIAADRPLATPLSAHRNSSVGTARQAGRYISSNSTVQQQQHDLSRPLRTPRILTTPRSVGGQIQTRKSDQERVEETRDQLRLLRNQSIQLRHLAARVETAVQQKQEKAAAALASAATAVIDLYGQLAAVQKQLQQKQWQSMLSQVVQRQLPRLREWCTMQEQSQLDASHLQHACNAAFSHVPLLNGTSVGQLPEQPDLELLQQQLVHGMQLLEEVQPALQKLLGPDLQAAQTHITANTAADKCAMHLPSSSSSSNSSKPTDVHHSIRTTASLADQLMCVAREECNLLSQLAQQMDRLSDLHLYANSMHVQLAQMKPSSC